MQHANGVPINASDADWFVLNRISSRRDQLR